MVAHPNYVKINGKFVKWENSPQGKAQRAAENNAAFRMIQEEKLAAMSPLRHTMGSRVVSSTNLKTAHNNAEAAYAEHTAVKYTRKNRKNRKASRKNRKTSRKNRKGSRKNRK
jgi:hypothetical protein